MINFEVPPPSKRMRIVEDEGVEQLQPTALDSEETTTTGEAARNMCYGVHTHVQLYIHHIPTHVYTSDYSQPTWGMWLHVYDVCVSLIS